MPKKAAKRPAPAAAAGGGGKAMKAAGGGAVATSGGGPPVDALEFSKVSSGATVHGDYAFLGNQVDISNNNNKFYRGQVVLDGGKAYCWTRWGRVGEPGQNKLEPAGNADGAIKLFEKKFKDKTGHKWAGASQTYPGGTSKKYTVIVEKYSNDSAAKLEAAGLGAGEEIGGGGAVAAVKFAEPTIPKQVAEFTGLITDSDMFKSQLSSMGIDTKKMPLGDISQQTVDEGFKALLAVEAHLKSGKNDRNKLAQLCSNFYTYIPHAFGRKAPPLLVLDDIQKKKDMLNILSDVGSAVSNQKKTKGGKKGKKKAAGGKTDPLEPHPIDTAYEGLGACLTPVDKKSAEFKMIDTFTKNTQGHRKCTVMEVFEVDRELDDGFGKHAKLGNRKLLWHGTNVAVVAAILKSGLRIMPHSGGRVGSGIYLASENGKSAGYVTAQGHTGVMFLCEAVLGKQRFVTSDGQVGWNEKDPVSAGGFDSVLAIGQTEPDAKADGKLTLDGKPVTIPQGKVATNPEVAKHGGSTSFAQSEYLVYNESRCRIRYVLQMKFETPGGHWH